MWNINTDPDNDMKGMSPMETSISNVGTFVKFR